MKAYYCVKSEFYANGTVKAAMFIRNCREKPRDVSRSFYGMGAYADWFETQGEAEGFLAEVMAADKQGAVA